MVESMKFAFADRGLLGDPKFANLVRHRVQRFASSTEPRACVFVCAVRRREFIRRS